MSCLLWQKVYLPVMSDLSAEVQKFLVHFAVAGGFYRYVFTCFVFAVYIVDIHSLELVQETDSRLGVVIPICNGVVYLRDMVEIFYKSVV